MDGAEGQPALPRELRLWDLVLFNVSAVAGVRWLSAAAHAGPGSLTLWVLAILLFFLPCALVISSLSARFPDEGGLYVWTKMAFGDWHGFVAGWFYVLSNLIFFPTLLIAGVAMASFLFGPRWSHLAETRSFTLPVTLLVLALAFLLNLLGLRLAKWTGNLGGFSTYTVAAILVVCGVVVALRYGSATSFRALPTANWDTINFWSQIAFAMIGLECGAILGGEIREPRRTIPRAAAISGAACALFYLAGTAALLVLRKPADVSELTGLAQAGQTAGAKLALPWLTGLFAALISVGVIGQVGSYVTANTRLPYVIGLDRYLPSAFARLHPRWGTPYISILTQGLLSVALLLTIQFGETLRAAYQILVDMCVVTAFVPFVYLFAAAIRFGQKIAGTLGLLVSLAAMLLSIVPPPGIASVAIFELKVIGGCLIMVAAGRWIFQRA